MGQALVDLSFRLFWQGRLIYTDPHPGNYVFLDDGRLGLLDFGSVRVLEGEEWDYNLLAGRALREGGATLETLLAQSLELAPGETPKPDHRQAIVDWCEWLWKPLRQTGPFDFSDPEYFAEGMQLFAVILRKRYTRAKPVNTWCNRNFVGVRAMLHHLGARADMRAAEERTSPHGSMPASS